MGRNIERIILVAGMSCGWAPEIARDWLQSAFWTLGSWYCAIVAMLRLPVPTLYAMRQGQPFIVQTRLEWLALTRSNRLAEKRRTRARELKPIVIKVRACRETAIEEGELLQKAPSLFQ